MAGSDLPDLAALPSGLAEQAQSSLGRVTVWSKLVDSGGDMIVNLALGVAILAVTIWLAGWVNRLVRAGLARAAGKRGVADPTLQIFAGSVARNIVLIIGLVAVLQQLGVRTTSIIAVLGAASLAVGLALQGALSNVAAGVMILLFRPYRVGDIIETGDRKGRVKALDLFVTELATLDNLKVVIPNGKLFGDVIVNHTTHDRRRADAIFRLPMDADVSVVIGRISERLAADPRVLPDPPPLVEVMGMAEVWVEVAARPWVGREDYGRVRSDVMLCARLLADNPQAQLPPLPKRAEGAQAETERTPATRRRRIPGPLSARPREASRDRATG